MRVFRADVGVTISGNGLPVHVSEREAVDVNGTLFALHDNGLWMDSVPGTGWVMSRAAANQSVVERIRGWILVLEEQIQRIQREAANG